MRTALLLLDQKVWTYSLRHECFVPLLFTRHTNIWFRKLSLMSYCTVLMSLLFCLTVQNFVIYGFIPSARANQLCESLRTSAIVDRFEVGFCSNLYYKIIDHSFVILSSPPPPLMKSLPLALSSTFRRSCSGSSSISRL